MLSFRWSASFLVNFYTQIYPANYQGFFQNQNTVGEVPTTPRIVATRSNNCILVLAKYLFAKTRMANFFLE